MSAARKPYSGQRRDRRSRPLRPAANRFTFLILCLLKSRILEARLQAHARHEITEPASAPSGVLQRCGQMERKTSFSDSWKL